MTLSLSSESRELELQPHLAMPVSFGQCRGSDVNTLGAIKLWASTVIVAETARLNGRYGAILERDATDSLWRD